MPDKQNSDSNEFLAQISLELDYYQYLPALTCEQLVLCEEWLREAALKVIDAFLVRQTAAEESHSSSEGETL